MFDTAKDLAHNGLTRYTVRVRIGVLNEKADEPLP